MASLLILGAGYVGAALADAALAAGHRVTLADNWYATERDQLAELEGRGARVETADVRSREDLDRLLADRPDRVHLLAAQASRPLSETDPDYTEETNLTGARRVAEAVAAAGAGALVYASSLNVYGPPDGAGPIDVDRPFGPQGDLAHLSKVYAELCLRMYAERHGFDLAILRLGIAYGPSPVQHDRPESQTVVDKFRRLAASGEPLPLDDGGRREIGVVHVSDVARILLDAPAEPGVTVANVAAESLTVAGVAALARGEDPPEGIGRRYVSDLPYRHSVADYLSASR